MTKDEVLQSLKTCNEMETSKKMSTLLFNSFIQIFKTIEFFVSKSHTVNN